MTVSHSEVSKWYVCPGEKQPISRPVHLARLAACYPSCRDCPFRHEIGALIPPAPAQASSRHLLSPPAVFREDGIRGRYLNELDRSLAGRLTAAFAARLWEAVFPAGEPDENKCRQPSFPESDEGLVRRPAVAVGYDQRPFSADIVAGVTDAARRMGCDVIDVGPVTTPLFWWAVAERNVTGGIFVTGSGCDPSRTGLDFVGPAGQPLSRQHPGEEETPGGSLSLDELERTVNEPINRPTRTAGQFRLVRGFPDYERHLASAFHALRPLKVVIGVPTELLAELVQRLFAGLPCRLLPVLLPVRARDVTAADDADVRHLAESIRSENADLGFLIDEDGQHCALLDESGTLVPPAVLTVWLAAHLLFEQPAGRFLLDTRLPADVDAAVLARGGHPRRLTSNRSRFFTALTQPAAFSASSPAESSSASFPAASFPLMGAEASGRYWFRPAGETPLPVLCDALWTLSQVLAALSRADRECSQQLEKIQREPSVAVSS